MQKHFGEKYLASGMIISMCLWGLNWPSCKVLTKYCSVVNITVYRYVLVGATLLLVLPLLKVSLRIKKKGIPFIVASGALLACYSYFTFMGLKRGAAGAGGVLVTTLNPLLAYTLSMILRKKLPSKNETIGLLIGLAGGCSLLKIWDGSASLLQQGNLYFLLAAMIWATLSMFTARGAAYGSSMGFSLWQYIVTLLCLLPFTDFSEARLVWHIADPLFWLNLFFGSVIVTALATTMYFYATTRIGAGKASSFIFLVPLAAAVSSWAFLGERIMPHTAIGGVLGMAAVYIINKRTTVARSVTATTGKQHSKTTLTDGR